MSYGFRNPPATTSTKLPLVSVRKIVPPGAGTPTA